MNKKNIIYKKPYHTTERLEQQESQTKQIEWFGGGSVFVILGKFIKGRGWYYN